jgi:uncharacterized protein with ParB-like and HNH nuclease domain
MKAGESGTQLGQVIRSYSSMKVEDYQRTYSWKSEDVDYFFQDLIDASLSPKENHFFGTLIFQEVPGDNNKVTIVDGQQRLTTVFLTIAAIRDEVLKLGVQEIPPPAYGMAPERPAEEATKLIVNNEGSGVFYRYQANRFIKQIIDSSVFAHPDQQSAIKDKHKQNTLALRHAVKRVRDNLQDILSGLSESQKLKTLNNLLKTITEKFIVLKIETTSISESLEIFLTLNDRGQPLGPSDIVKGKIMAARGRGLSDERQLELQEQINIDWDELVDSVREPETFLRHFLLSTGSSKVQKKKVVSIVESRLKQSQNQTEQQVALAFWEELKTAGSVYGHLISGSLASQDSQYHMMLLEGLQKSHRIFLLALMSREDTSSSEFFDELIRLTFILSYRWTAADKGRQELEDKFFELAMFCSGNAKDHKGKEVVYTPEELTQAIKKLAESVEVDFEAVFSRNIDSSFIVRAALHYSQKLAAGSAILPMLKDTHLEHIAPQSSTPDWLKEVYHNQKEKYENYENLVTAAGNLTLLDPGLNTKIGNKPFSNKRAEYEKSSMYLTRDLSGFDIWDEQLIQDRTDWLASNFSQICSVEKFTGQIETFSNWHSSHRQVL